MTDRESAESAESTGADVAAAPGAVVAAEPIPAILVLDDEPASVDLLRITLGLEYPVFTATDGETALGLLAEHPEIALAIVDQRMPGMSGTEFIARTVEPYPDLIRVILTGYTDAQSLIEAINAGKVYRYLTKPWNKDEILGVVRQGLEVWRLERANRRLQAQLEEANSRLRVENVQLRRDARERYRFDEIIGSSPALEQMLALLDRIVATESTVLILGETGTGKDLVARAIHYNGPRADRPFVAENCGALSPELLASELFGHRRGSFTGATADHEGLFEAAQGGTVFLDEMGEMPLSMQPKVLRVLQEGEVTRIGEIRPRKVEFRLVAATNRDLLHEVERGAFRGDLFYRISAFPIRIPALRERRSDVPLLVESFLGAAARRQGKRVGPVTAAAMRALVAFDWPGNVRELQNEVQRAVALAKPGQPIDVAQLSPKLVGIDAASENSDGPGDRVSTSPGLASGPGSLRAARDAFESRYIAQVLEQQGGSVLKAARVLGLTRAGLYKKLKEFGLR